MIVFLHLFVMKRNWFYGARELLLAYLHSSMIMNQLLNAVVDERKTHS